MESNKQFIIRLVVTILFVLSALVGKCDLKFYYTTDTDTKLLYRFESQIRRTLINIYGWKWYFQNMLVSPFTYMINFSNHSSMVSKGENYNDDTYDIKCGLWISTFKDSVDFGKIDYIKEAIDLMAENNDSIIETFPLDGYTTIIDFKKFKTDLKYRNSIFRNYLSSNLNDALTYAFFVGKCTKCYLEKNTRFITNIFQRTGYLTSVPSFINAIYLDKLEESIMKNYFSECEKLDIRTLVDTDNYYNASPEEIDILGKYVTLYDNYIINQSVPQDIYMVDFIYRPQVPGDPIIIHPENTSK